MNVSSVGNQTELSFGALKKMQKVASNVVDVRKDDVKLTAKKAAKGTAEAGSSKAGFFNKAGESVKKSAAAIWKGIKSLGDNIGKASKKSYATAKDIIGGKNKVAAGILAGILLMGAVVAAGAKAFNNGKAINELKERVDDIEAENAEAAYAE